jgi:hypothetical protein
MLVVEAFDDPRLGAVRALAAIMAPTRRFAGTSARYSAKCNTVVVSRLAPILRMRPPNRQKRSSGEPGP